MENIVFFNGPGAFPPAFQGDRYAYALSIFGLLGTTLLALDWLYRIVLSLIDRRQALRAPVTLSRIIVAGVLASVLCRIVPDVLLIMLWPEISPHSRATIALIDRVMDGVSIVPMTVAWTIGLFAVPIIEFQLMRQPIPVDLWPSWQRIRRPLGIGAMILTIALTLAFLR